MSQQRVGASYVEQNSIDTLLNTASWQQAVQMKATNGKTIIYVPISNAKVGLEFFYDSKLMSVDSGNLIRVVCKETSMHGTQIIGVQAYYESIVLHHDVPAGFNGTITAFSIRNRYLYDYTFWDGSIRSHGIAAPKNDQTILKAKTDGVKTNNDCELWGHFTIWGNGEITLDYTYLVCSGDCQSTAIGIKSGQLYIRSNCGGGGGSGDQALPSVQYWNNVTDPCLKKLVDRVLSSVTLVTTTLNNNYFGNNAYYAMSYHDAALGSSGTTVTNGQTNPSIYTAPDGIRYIDITLNSDVLTNTSQEFAAITIMHEALHAMLLADGAAATNFAQHNEIANKYVSDLANSLFALFGMTQLDAYALAWSGLDVQSTSAWAALDPTTQATYQGIALNYWMNGSLGTRPAPGSCN